MVSFWHYPYPIIGTKVKKKKIFLKTQQKIDFQYDNLRSYMDLPPGETDKDYRRTQPFKSQGKRS